MKQEELAEPVVEEFDRVDGMGAGTVKDLLTAGGARRNDHRRDRLIISTRCGGAAEGHMTISALCGSYIRCLRDTSAL